MYELINKLILLLSPKLILQWILLYQSLGFDNRACCSHQNQKVYSALTFTAV